MILSLGVNAIIYNNLFFPEISRLHYLSYRRLGAIFLILRKSFLKFLQLNYTDITIIGSSKEHIDIFMTNNFA